MSNSAWLWETQAAPEQGDGCIDGVKMPERIWLVWEGGEISWSADPDPSGLTTDAVKYTRAALTPEPFVGEPETLKRSTGNAPPRACDM